MSSHKRKDGKNWDKVMNEKFDDFQSETISKIKSGDCLIVNTKPRIINRFYVK